MAAVAAAAVFGGPEVASSSGAGSSPHHLGGAAHLTSRRRSRGPGGWLRRALRGAQAVAEERPAAHQQEDDDEADDASYDGAPAQPLDDCCFGSLPEHLLEKVFSHLRGTNRKHHFAICGVNRQWRRLGQAMFFSRPWEVAHLICHPTQLFCLSPRGVTGSRSGLLKCFVRRDNGPDGKRFTFHIGKDASQPQRSRFLLAAKQGGRDELLLYLNSRCQGQPCARLRCNMFATQYKLTLAEDMQLEPTGSSRSRRKAEADEAAAAAARRAGGTSWSVGRPGGTTSAAGPSGGSLLQPIAVSRLSSWGNEAAAEAAVAAATLAARRQARAAAVGSGPAAGACGQACELDQLGVDCFADLQYQARVKGFMQPRRMRVVLPHPSLLFYDHQLPLLSRRPSELDPRAASTAAAAASAAAFGSSVSAASGVGAGQLSPRHSSGGGALAWRGAVGGASSGPGTPEPALAPEGSPGQAAGGLAAAPAATEAAAGAAAALPAGNGGGSSRGGGLRGFLRRKQRLLRQQKTVPADEVLQPVVLHNKSPHWNEALRCWCLNFRGRVKLASVKNFQLVRADDPSERVVMQFGKAEQDAFILDFNPTVLTAISAFGIVLSTFDSKFLL